MTAKDEIISVELSPAFAAEVKRRSAQNVVDNFNFGEYVSDGKYSSLEPVVRKKAPEAIIESAHIAAIKKYFIDKGKFRDNFLFVVGTNCALRCGDILTFRFGNFLEEKNGSLVPREYFLIREEKTEKIRKVYFDAESISAFALYVKSLSYKPTLNDFVFQSQSPNGRLKRNAVETDECGQAEPDATPRENGQGMWVWSISRTLKNAVKKLNLPYQVASHTMRKTFAYRFLNEFKNNAGELDKARALFVLQKILNHSSAVQTLDYIGITDKEIARNCARATPTEQYDIIMQTLGA